MFAFGTNDFGTDRCYDDGCACLCETSASPLGSCNTVSHNGYRLYKYQLQEQGNHQQLSIFLLVFKLDVLSDRTTMYVN